MTVDVIIPVYKPDKELLEALRRLEVQTQPVNRIIIMNTEKEYWDRWAAELLQEDGCIPKNIEVFHVTRDEFDHGGTRDAGIKKSRADVCVLLTDDALPVDRHLLGNLVKALYLHEDIAVSYGKQLPKEDCGAVERYTRSFNYPSESRIKTIGDLDQLGIKTFFCSNVCAAYRRDVYEKLGGFTKKTIFNEDMIFAANAMKQGYRVAYAADAEVVHSHNYSVIQQFHRNFDLAVSQKDHPEVFEGIRSEGEGIRLVRKTASRLLQDGKFYLIPHLVVNSGCRYLGYLLGKRYRSLPLWLVLRCTMNKNYWKGYVRQDV